MLHFRELVDLRLPLQLVMYAYHYQRRDGALVFRYDNTVHHMSVDTFPHHKHTSQGKIVSSDPVRLEAALREVGALIAANADEG